MLLTDDLTTPASAESIAQSAVFEQIALGLEMHGYVVLENGLPETLQTELLNDLGRVPTADFEPAGVGRGQQWQRNLQTRRDKIAWIEGASDSTRLWLKWTDDLRCYLNRRLYLGLFSFESHYAIYHPGDFYQTHVDAFRGSSNRTLSLVTYLNRDWQLDWGGQLRLYNDSATEAVQTVSPQLGTLVVFLSEDFPHEVLPATQTRYSVAGWFRLKGAQ